MTDLVERFLLANLAAAIAVLLVLFFRKPARRMFGARLAYTLWLLVPAAALASLLPPRVIEIVVPAFEPAFPPLPVEPLAAPPIDLAPGFEPVTAAPQTPMPARFDPWRLAALLWFAGVLAMAAWLAFSQSRFMADARAGRAGPAVVGFLRPRIVTPSDFEDRFEPHERDIVLAHEAIHLRRNDARINALVALLRCLCWFNPMVHVGAHLMRIDQELACDAAVVERHPRAKAVYASALLKAQLAARSLPLGCYWPAGAEHPLTERIEMLKQAAPGRARRIAGAGVLAVLALGACVSSWAAKPAETRFIVDASEPQHSAPLEAASNPRVGPRFDPEDYVVIRGRVVTVDPGDTDTYVWVEAETVHRNYGPETPNAQLWRVEKNLLWKEIERISPKRLPGPPAVGDDIRIDGYVSKDKSCSPACVVQAMATDLNPKASDSGAPGPASSGTLDTTTQPINYQRNQSPAGQAHDADFDSADPIHLFGRVEKIDFGDSTYVAFVRASSIAACPTGPAQANTQLWELAPTPYWGDRDAVTRDLMNQSVYIRGFNAKDKSCTPNCRIQARGVFKVRGGPQSFPYPGAFTDRALNCLPPPATRAAPQPTRYEPQQAPSSAASGAGTDQPVFVRGKVEKIAFGDAAYVMQLRASSLGRDTSSSALPILWGEYVNTALWELSPTNYFGERDSIEKDLLGREIIVRGDTSSGLSCASGCRIKVRELVVPKSTAVPAPGSRPFSISDFAMHYDTTQPMLMSGKVQRLEFADRTFDVWMQTKGHGVDPGVLYQVRSEYFLPRADIEARLRNQDIVASGWPARGDYHGFCSPVCGMYAEMMWLENGTPLAPGSNRPISPPPVASAAAGGRAEPARYEPQAPAGPLAPNSDAPIVIQSNTFDRFQNEGRGVYSGNAQMTQGDSRLTTDKLTVTCQRGASQGECVEIQTLIAEGNVAFTSPDISIRSNHAEYDYAAAAITFTGDVVSMRGDRGIVRGAKAVYNVRENRLRMTSDPVTSTRPPASDGLKPEPTRYQPQTSPDDQQAPSPAAQIIPVQLTSPSSRQPLLRLNGKTSPVLDGSSVVTSGFGDRVDPYNSRTAFHEGVDLAAPFDAPVHAPTQAVVTFAGVRGDGRGRVVELDLGNSTKMLFGHLNEIRVKEGAEVKPGAVIGTVGSTGRSAGAHLHLEYIWRDKSFDPATVKNLVF